MGRTTLKTALRKMGFGGKEGIDFSPHGFRGTASTLLNEAGYRGDVIERQRCCRKLLRYPETRKGALAALPNAI